MQQAPKEFLVCEYTCEICMSTQVLIKPFSSHTYFLLTVVEQLTGNDHVLNHLSIPAACFTHPEISMVGLTEVNKFSRT